MVSVHVLCLLFCGLFRNPEKLQFITSSCDLCSAIFCQDTLIELEQMEVDIKKGTKIAVQELSGANILPENGWNREEAGRYFFNINL